ncbi:MAG: dihydroorotase [Actinobacteria bacterium]|nr:dihydroorotase [Actinomycetota bacterium]
MDVTVPRPAPRLALRSRPPEQLLLPDVHLFDPACGLDRRGSLLVRGGVIVAIGKSGGLVADAPDATVLAHLAGCHVFPGFVDMHAHLRTPGQEYKEDLASAARAAAAGGFVLVAGMANTDPPVDAGPLAAWVLDQADEVADVAVAQVGAVSHGLRGEALSELWELADAGVVAFSDDGRALRDLDLLLTALRYAGSIGRPLLLHLEDASLAADGVMHEGAWSARLGLRGIPTAAESGPLARDLEVLRAVVEERARRSPTPGTASRVPLLHLQHLSTAASVRLLRDAKAAGLPVTAEVTPHHLLLGDDLVSGFDQSLKVNPPLRAAEDRAALLAALVEGVIDCVATDHAPHAPHEKEVPFEDAPFGSVGLETAFPALYGGLVETGSLTLARLVEALSTAPCRILGVEAPRLEVGSAADICAVDLEESWEVTTSDLYGKSRNSAFLGRRVRGRVAMTMVKGARRFERTRKARDGGHARA